MTFYRISITNAQPSNEKNKKRRVFSIQTGGFDTDKDAKQVVY